MSCLGVRQVVAKRHRRRRRIEVLLDVVEPKQPAGRGHVQRAVSHRETVRLIETGGDDHNAIGFVIPIGVHDRVHRPCVLRSDEDSALRAERQRSSVLHPFGEDFRPEAGRQHQRPERPRRRLLG